jgi:hypothetical protein
MNLYGWFTLIGLSTLLAKSVVPSKKFVPGFKNVIEIKHAIPGRIRFLIPELKNAGNIEGYLKEQLTKLQAIETVEVNTITGSVLLKFDPKLESEILVAALLKLLDLERYAENNPPSMIGNEINQVGSALNRAVYEKTNGLMDAKTGLSLLLLSYGIYQIIRRGLVIAPNGFNLLWWAYRNQR